MNASRRLYLPALLAGALAACSAPGVGFRVEPVGAVDLEGANDQIDFALENAVGFASGRWTLVLPADWPVRSHSRVEPGLYTLDHRGDPDWRRFEEVHPRCRPVLSRSALTNDRREQAESQLSTAIVLDERWFDPLDAAARAREVASNDGDCYVIVESVEPQARRYRIHGLLRSDDGDPESQSLVRLVSLRFVDGRNDFEWAVDETFRITTSVIGIVLFVPVVAIGMIADGFIPESD